MLFFACFTPDQDPEKKAVFPIKPFSTTRCPFCSLLSADLRFPRVKTGKRNFFSHEIFTPFLLPENGGVICVVGSLFSRACSCAPSMDRVIRQGRSARPASSQSPLAVSLPAGDSIVKMHLKVISRPPFHPVNLFTLKFKPLQNVKFP